MKNQFKGILAVLLFVICLPSISSLESGEIYKWKSKDGNIVFYDTPLPPGGDAEIKRFKGDVTEGPTAKENIPRPKSESFREKRSYSDIRVIMYMTSWCPYCNKARTYLHSLNVNLIEFNIERDKSKREEMLTKSGGATGVPLIDVEGMIIRGYNPEAMKAAIEKRR